jgi:hypothetical protein
MELIYLLEEIFGKVGFLIGEYQFEGIQLPLSSFPFASFLRDLHI